MDPHKLDLFKRFSRYGGIGGGLIALAGASAFGLYKSFYTRFLGSNILSYMISDPGQKKLPPQRAAKTVNITLRVLFRPDVTKLPEIYRTIGGDYDERVLPSIVNEVLKAVVAKFNAGQMITQRQQVSLLVRKQLVDRARDFNIVVDDVSITDLSFSTQYSAAVEAKQIAHQEAQRAQFLVERAKQEKQQKIVMAEGESQAAKLIGDALAHNPGYLKLRKIKAAIQISKTVSQSQNRAYLSAGGLFVNTCDPDFDLAADRGVRKK